MNRAARLLAVLLITWVTVHMVDGHTPVRTAPNGQSLACDPPSRSEANDRMPGRSEAPNHSNALTFIENRGQWTSPARFVGRAGSTAVAIEPGALAVALLREKDGTGGPVRPFERRRRSRSRDLEGTVVRFELEGADRQAAIEGEGPGVPAFRFLIGNDPSRWRTAVPGHPSVIYRGVYPGVDLRVVKRRGAIAYDLLLAPGADPEGIRVRVRGATALSLAHDGSLVIDTPLGPLRQPPPTTWAERPDGEREPLDCHYRIVDDESFRFDLQRSEGAWPVVIDPSLEWSTFLGGSDLDILWDIDADSFGPIVVGETLSLDFPTTPGVLGPRSFGFWDAVVTRLAADGRSLLWSTYLGGSGADEGVAVRLATNGDVIVGGNTFSPDLPTTPSAYDTTFDGYRDIFVARLDPTGSSLRFGTYFGGNQGFGNVECLTERCLAIGPDGSIALTGATTANDFPVTPNASQPSNGGLYDAFASVISGDGSLLLHSTYLGGSSFEQGTSIDVDLNSGELVVTGDTSSADFPLTANVYDNVLQLPGFDAFVTVLAGERVVSSSFLGGSSLDGGEKALWLNPNEVVVYGETSSVDFPTTNDAIHKSNPGALSTFVSVLDRSLSSLIWSTYLGGSGVENSSGMRFHSSGSLMLTGSSHSPDFPLTPSAFDSIPDAANGDGFLVRMNLTTKRLEYSSFLGGSGPDLAVEIASDTTGRVFLCGETLSADFPTSPGAFDRSLDGPADGFVACLEMGPIVELRGQPSQGSQVHFEISAIPSAEIGRTVQVVLSCTGTAGIALPGGQVLPLTADICTTRSLLFGSLLRATITGSVATTSTITLPPLPAGIPLWAAALTWSPGTGVVATVTSATSIVTQ
ncbi:MAG: hypothetical protein RL885_02505 [Planctomycetota bacterium]